MNFQRNSLALVTFCADVEKSGEEEAQTLESPKR
jgi:hypothetical protein